MMRRESSGARSPTDRLSGMMAAYGDKAAFAQLASSDVGSELNKSYSERFTAMDHVRFDTHMFRQHDAAQPDSPLPAGHSGADIGSIPDPHDVDATSRMNANVMDEFAARRSDIDAQLHEVLYDTPLRRLEAVAAAATAARAAGEPPEVELQLRRDALGLALMHARLAKSPDDAPLAVPAAHAALARCYAGLRYGSQARSHGRKALAALARPLAPGALAAGTRLHRRVHALLAEIALESDQPDPATALHHLEAADPSCADVIKRRRRDSSTDEIPSIAPDEDPEMVPDEVKDVAFKALVGQAHGLLGESDARRLKDLHKKRTETADRVMLAEEMLVELDDAGPDSGECRSRVRDLRVKVEAMDKKLTELVGSATDHLDAGIDFFMQVIDVEAARLRASGQERDPETGHPHALLRFLWSRTSELMYAQAGVKGRAGLPEAKLQCLQEILTAHRSNGAVYLDLISNVLKQIGALQVARHQGEAALKTYSDLGDLERIRWENNPAKAAVHVAEATKLEGNVYVAQQKFDEAEAHYASALQVFMTHLGAKHKLSTDLHQRMAELQLYRRGAVDQIASAKSPARV